MPTITDEDLILMHYRELDPAAAAALAEALAADPALAARYRALTRTLAAAGDAEFPAADAELGARVWARVEPRLGAQQQPLPRRAAAWLAFAATTLASTNAGAAPSTSISAAGRERVLLTRVALHLDGSQRLLTSVSNSVPGRADLDEARAWAQRALAANRVYRSAAANAGEKRVVALLDAMEPLLIEIANAPDALAPEDLEFLQQRIAEADLLFRMRSTQKRIEQRANQAAPGAVQTTRRSDI